MDLPRDVHFVSDGLKCSGLFFRTTDRGKAPCIILAHGFGATLEMRLRAYAERFAEAGYHALVFDYRHFGMSEGAPRQVLDIKKQQQDWRAAIQFAKSLPEVDPRKIVLWGTSFSGGHVLQIAAKRADIAAVISQVPHLSGFAAARVAGLRHSVGLSLASFKDLTRELIHLEPFYVRTIGQPGELAVISAPGEADAWRRLYPSNVTLNENVAARVILSILRWSPGKYAAKLKVPWLVQVATQDLTTPPKPAIEAAQKAPMAELILYDKGHFDVYVAPHFERTIGDQLEFLKRNVHQGLI